MSCSRLLSSSRTDLLGRRVILSAASGPQRCSRSSVILCLVGFFGFLLRCCGGLGPSFFHDTSSGVHRVLAASFVTVLGPGGRATTPARLVRDGTRRRHRLLFFFPPHPRSPPAFTPPYLFALTCHTFPLARPFHWLAGHRTPPFPPSPAAHDGVHYHGASYRGRGCCPGPPV